MRKLYTIITIILVATGVWAQSPEKMSYQTVIRNASDNLVMSQMVGMQISILQGSESGTPVYVETQTPTTNTNGLVTLEIGTGVTSDVFSTINWANSTYFIKTETDPAGGTSYTITGTSQLLSVPYALHAKTAENISGTITYSVGDFAQGGIVFWVDEAGQHGLVCAKTDQSTGVRWYAGTFGDTRAYGDHINAGEMNTDVIIRSSYAIIGYDGDPFASQICKSLTLNGYSDWYLPSKEELNLMYLNKATIDATAIANGGTAFAITNYWSSTEFSYGNACDLHFSDGSQYFHSTDNTAYVRSVRSF